MRGYNEYHFLIKVGAVYLCSINRMGLTFVPEEFKHKALKLDEESVVEHVNRVAEFGFKANLIRVDEVLTITEKEIGSVEGIL